MMPKPPEARLAARSGRPDGSEQSHDARAAHKKAWREALDELSALPPKELVAAADIWSAADIVGRFLHTENGSAIDESSDDAYLYGNILEYYGPDSSQLFPARSELHNISCKPDHSAQADVLTVENTKLFEIRGHLKSFNFTKQYGFISSKDIAGDVFLHSSCLVNSGFYSAHKGSRIHCLATMAKTGLTAFRILAIDETPKSHLSRIRGPMRRAADALSDWVRAEVKSFNNVRGYGFLTLGDGSSDLFIHRELLIRFGLLELRPGQFVSVRWGEGTKGRTVAEIRAVNLTLPNRI